MEITTTGSGARRVRRVLVKGACLAAALVLLALLVPAALGYERHVIADSSMAGSMGVGTVVLERRVPVGELQAGDVITYRPPPDSGVDGLVSHRIVTIHEGVVRTKGDANAYADPWMVRLPEASQPRVEHTVPYVGWLFLALDDHRLQMALLGVPAAFLALAGLRRLSWSTRPVPEPPSPRTSGSGHLTSSPQNPGWSAEMRTRPHDVAVGSSAWTPQCATPPRPGPAGHPRSEGPAAALGQAGNRDHDV